MTRRRALTLAAGLIVAAVVGGVLGWGGGDEGAEVDASSEPSAATTTTTARRTTTTTPTTATTAAPSSTTSAAPAPTAPPATTLAPTTAPAPPFASSVEAVTAEQLGSSWRAGCPVGPDGLRAVNVSHWGYDGAVHGGRVIVAAAEADRMVAAFRALYDARFPVQQVVPVDRFGGDDQASMRANNTSAFNCRYVAGTTRWSEHAFGRAIDVNPLVNPYVKGGTVDPPEGAPYADRSRTDPGMIHAGDAAVQAFAAQGWGWGGYWSSGQDYQHFSASGR